MDVTRFLARGVDEELYLVSSPDVHAAPVGDRHVPAALGGAVVLQLLKALLGRRGQLLVRRQLLVLLGHLGVC